MRINSVTLRNCRLHHELKVEFDPSRTLIGGPNETGKSTLIEAVHRALFLKAKGNTEHHRALTSSLHPGHPEVDLTFDAGGHTYLLKKRFGSNGTTTLSPSNSVLLSGDAAESELARLLSVEAGISGKAIIVQWAHLWVWQGQAGDDPSTHATAQQNGLLQRLQQMGGAAALQSELDARVAKHFTDAKDQIYTQAGKAKAGSELERAERGSSSARAELALATDRVQKLDSAVTNLERASRTLLETSTSVDGLEKQLEETDARAQQLGDLRQQESEQSHALNGAVNRYSSLESTNKQILTAHKDISELETNLKPQTKAITQLEQSSQEFQTKAVAAETTHGVAVAAVRTARLNHDLASAHILLFEKTQAHTKHNSKAEKVSKLRSNLAALEQQLAKLPNVDKSKLHKIQKLETECSNARAALQAMATGLEVIAADKNVKVDGQTIKVGQQQILSEDTEVQIGSAIRLRIRPGGGNNLAEARQTESEALSARQTVLDSLGIQSVEKAMAIHAGREDLNSRIKTATAELEGMGAENLAEELQDSATELTTVKANVERLAVLTPDLNAPNDKAAAKAAAKTLAEKLSEAEDQESEAKTTRDRAAKTSGDAEEALKKQRAETDQQRLDLNGLKAQLDLLLKTHGDDTARTHDLVEGQSAKLAAQTLYKATTNAIAALQPELLEGDRTRIARAIKEKTNERHEAGNQIAVARATLSSDGSEDPATELANAEAKARSSTEHESSVQRKSQAIALLDQLFQEEQHSLSKQFTQPLADKISGYLQCIFGTGACAQVDLENNEFTGLRLSRPGFGVAPFAFDALSGGAKEQTAAAVRLAMAEVLASDYDGCLPVVFDDAFAYSDPDRVNQLQRMLDLAATRGLQVIVLTCNPADYASLGAKTVTLRSQLIILNPKINPFLEGKMESSDATSFKVQDQLPDSAASVAVTDDLRQTLLTALLNLCGSKGNQTLREQLGWDDATYSAVKNDLVAAGKLIPGKGRGGSVALPNL